jgi:hypothetical protein
MTNALDVTRGLKGTIEFAPEEHDDDRRARIIREERADNAAHSRDRLLFYVLIGSYVTCFVLGIVLLWINNFSVDTSQGKLGWMLLTNLLTAFISALAGFRIGQKGK